MHAANNGTQTLISLGLPSGTVTSPAAQSGELVALGPAKPSFYILVGHLGRI